ncbi:MAG: lipoate--protein ligase [Deltaproteobacteria bacterium CG_4_8_14_3_um_filter_45_9]|jgi:lipoate-protein ligase A|nr:MAG: lipoate--protein ligase [Deltaproteobacteria bacterium CG03_land_8_20_14_0_80_45_14]PIX25808.1 MAG: lipoate--protein ligase [Deltaproteobacteria bacterium CG_4_8_14_3_um_filter_45_9]
MMETWRLLDTGVLSAAENMALDETLLELKAGERIPHTLRFLQFSNPTVLVGHHQSVGEEVRLDYCRNQRIEINRRLTGGGALYWGKKELGWEIYISKNDPRIPSRIEDLYRRMGEAASLGLRHLGIRAHFRPRNDIEIQGRKISGTGGTELSGAILFQGTVLVDFDVDEMLRALRIPTEKLQDKEIESVKERVTCLKWELGRTPPIQTIKASLTKGFEEAFGIRFENKSLTNEEDDLLKTKLPYFSSPDYIFKIRDSLPRRKTLSSILKAPGGLIRISIAIDSKTHVINQILITGDFFAYPKRAIFDLESLLKNSKASPSSIEGIIRSFFSDKKLRIPGVTEVHFIRALDEAIQKMHLLPQGFNEEETHHLFPVLKPFKEVRKPEVLLLPYCAKEVECDYRNLQGCDECGRCTVGDAAQMARSFGMDSVTIQNYEELESTLCQLKTSGVRAFIGSCCEPFYGKHRPDFERIGLPGILIDVERSTCYDLGQEKEAFKGRFENQTHLNLSLLKKVLEYSHD